MGKRFVVALLALTIVGVFGQERGTALGIAKATNPGPAFQITTSPDAASVAAGARMDPLLRSVVRAFRHDNSPANGAFDGLASVISLRESDAGAVEVAVFIASRQVANTRTVVGALGGTVRTTRGGIITATVPVAALETLAEHPDTRALQASSQSRPCMNVSHVEINADDVHAGIGLNRPYRGNGVVVGVLDSGIDWKHEDFDWSDHTSRIQYLWDMSGTSNPPSGYTYGTEYTKAQINANTCGEIDGNGGHGHGTHVTATAAGSGFAHPSYVGIAPESDIVFVKGIRDHDSNGGFADADVVDGCSYIFSKAVAMGKPAVINLSLGGQVGPHDGTSLYEQALSSLTGPGRIIVAAAGNAGGDFIHLSYPTQAGSDYNDALETVWIADGSNLITAADMWYDNGAISVGIAAYDAFAQLIGYTSPVAPGQLLDNMPFTVNGTTYGLISIDAQTVSDPFNNASRVVVVIDSDNGTYPINSVFWSLYTFGSGTFDAWIITGGLFTTDSGTWFRPGDNEKSVGSPSTAMEVISVASYVTKNQWVDINGATQIQLDNLGNLVTVGDISWFSSLGPSRDGRLKPEIAAPGEAIVSALSTDLSIGVGVQPENILHTGKHLKMQGTSQASPHVTGTVGLMLERDAVLTVAEVRAALSGSARRDGFTGTVPNTTFGHGKLDALGAVSRIPTALEPLPSTTAATFRLEPNYPNPFNPETRIDFGIATAERVTVLVFDPLGRVVATLVDDHLAAGRYRARWDGRDDGGHAVVSGVYFYRIRAGAFQQTRKMVLVK